MARLSADTHLLLTNDVIKLLNGGDIYTTNDFLQADIKIVAGITGLAHKDVHLIKNYIINKTAAVTRNAFSFYKELMRKSALIETGIESLDKLLGGGFMTGNLYELCGLPSTGKTQICLSISKNIAQKLSQNVFYIDTKRDFSAQRIKTLLHDCDQAETASVMSKILVKQVNTKYELINCLYGIKEEIISGLKSRLIIIDSLPTLCGTSDYTENNVSLTHIANVMRYLAVECFTVILITNIITTWSEGHFQQNLTEKVACGKYWRGVPQTRLKVENSSGNLRLSILRSNKSAIGLTCTARICEDGVV